ncbi:DUF3775 domain-containing protein [Parasulfitobacter algicola]|uniref:DUF3775 domain-containing protein n=1 Tax=Parasulfitobacter algicola TaxID=2614809 RepID=A0ABX2IWK1_9RHOB|nr:DUF3775 domain-containing protein [Sulfitobacter algicola]NSX56720.1 DUF3775 domain-containing protein [Sulfitobacter algicola]
MLEISIEKVAQVILYAREIERAEPEMRGFIDGLNDDEKASLVAVMWIGREAFAADDLEDAKRVAIEEATTPTADYLLGVPHLADNLESGLEALGYSASQAEEDLL